MQQRTVDALFGQNGCGKSYLSNLIGQSKPRLLIVDAGFKDFSATYFDSFDALVKALEDIEAFDTFRPFHYGYAFKHDELNLAFELQKRLKRTALLLDEGDRFDPDELPGYHDTIYYGRHLENDLIVNSLAPVDFPTALRRQITRLISFRQIMPSDLDWLYKIVGDAAFELSTLAGPDGPYGPKPPYPYLIWKSSSGAKIVKPGSPDYYAL